MSRQRPPASVDFVEFVAIRVGVLAGPGPRAPRGVAGPSPAAPRSRFGRRHATVEPEAEHRLVLGANVGCSSSSRAAETRRDGGTTRRECRPSSVCASRSIRERGDQAFGISLPSSPRPGRNQNRARSASRAQRRVRPGTRGADPKRGSGRCRRWSDAQVPGFRYRCSPRPGNQTTDRCPVVRDVVTTSASGDTYQGVNQIASTPRSTRYRSRDRTPARSPMPSPFASAKLRTYTW